MRDLYPCSAAFGFYKLSLPVKAVPDLGLTGYLTLLFDKYLSSVTVQRHLKLVNRSPPQSGRKRNGGIIDNWQLRIVNWLDTPTALSN